LVFRERTKILENAIKPLINFQTADIKLQIMHITHLLSEKEEQYSMPY
jgi:hypothetical protein